MIPKDSIRVTTGATSVRHFMSEAIIEFRYRNPQVNLEFRTASTSGECLAALLKGEADLAWIAMSDPAPGVEQRPALELPWVLAMRTGEIYSERAFVEIPELSGLRLIKLPEDSTSGAMLAAALADVSLAADAGIADWETALLLAELAVGHAIVPRVPGPLPVDGALRLVPVRGLPPLSVGWAARSWQALPTMARAFAETVSRNCRLK
jgi:DNA-binding transcriptional LysR family regulator